MISNYGNTMKILNKYGLNAKKKFGQNFIIDPSIVTKIARNCGANSQSLIIEIGPGLGALSEQLAKVARRVDCYEIDSDMVNVLKNELLLDNINVTLIDFLDVDLGVYDQEENIIICSNVPYYITTKLLFKIIESNLNYSQITFMVQKEMGQRLFAGVNSSDYNGLSVIMDYLFDRKILMNVPANCFYPRPKVDSVVLNLIKKNVEVDLDFFAFVKSCFGQRRKTLYNNLKGLYDSELLNKHLFDLKIRAQELSYQQFYDLYLKLHDKTCKIVVGE